MAKKNKSQNRFDNRGEKIVTQSSFIARKKFTKPVVSRGRNHENNINEKSLKLKPIGIKKTPNSTSPLKQLVLKVSQDMNLPLKQGFNSPIYVGNKVYQSANSVDWSNLPAEWVENKFGIRGLTTSGDYKYRANIPGYWKMKVHKNKRSSMYNSPDHDTADQFNSWKNQRVPQPEKIKYQIFWKRVWLEARGIDTTNPKAVLKFIKNRKMKKEFQGVI
tara:strand:+ start:64 stop:717 length:654 start_codon:yes stop_codon:yes gene_type:complete